MNPRAGDEEGIPRGDELGRRDMTTLQHHQQRQRGLDPLFREGRGSSTAGALSGLYRRRVLRLLRWNSQNVSVRAVVHL